MDAPGLVVPALVLSNDAGALDHPKNSRFVRSLLDDGVLHVLAGGPPPVARALSGPEHEKFLETVVESSTFSSDVWAEVGAADLNSTLERADMAEAVGASVLLVTPPAGLSPPGPLTELGQQLHGRSALPILLRQDPASCAQLPMPTLESLLRAGTVQGVVEASGTESALRALLPLKASGALLIAEGDLEAGACLLAGADGAILPTGSVLPRLSVALVKASLEGDRAKAQELQGLVATLRRALDAGPWPSALTFLSHHLRETDEGYRPTAPALTPEEGQRVLSLLAPADAALKDYL